MNRFNFIFHQGKRKGPVSNEDKKKAKFYHIRSSGGILAKRVIQVRIYHSCFPQFAATILVASFPLEVQYG